MLSKQIEKAQRKVEEQNFLIRKHTLDYDDVLNLQREVVYTYRDEILEGRDMSEAARGEITGLIERLVEEYTAGDFVEDWDVASLLARVQEIFIPSAAIAGIEANRVDREDLTQRLQEEALAQYDQREEELGGELMRALERFLLLQVIDQRWREHLYDMDYLREGIHLRGVAQIEPLVAYKNEAFALFRDLMNSVWGDFARMIFHVEVTREGENGGVRRRPRGASAPTRARRPGAAGSATPAEPRSSRAHSPWPRRPVAPAPLRPTPRRPPCPWSSSAGSTRPSRSGATTRAGAAAARSTRSATARSRLALFV